MISNISLIQIYNQMFNSEFYHSFAFLTNQKAPYEVIISDSTIALRFQPIRRRHRK